MLCDICGFAYIDKATLAKHKQVHDMSRPYACSYPTCQWRFKSEVSLLHLLVPSTLIKEKSIPPLFLPICPLIKTLQTAQNLNSIKDVLHSYRSHSIYV